ncbi:MAG: hypothetical protein E7J15_07735, partial [Neisseria sp.]|nr:hypothetical protein [Neisseria sp.]
GLHLRRLGQKDRQRPSEKRRSFRRPRRFVWDGSHFLQEIQPDGRYTYIYTDPDSHEPLAKYATGPTKTAKANRKSTTSTATKSAFRVR